MKFTPASFTALILLLAPSGVEACRRRRLAAAEDGRDIIPLTIRAGIVPGAFPVFLNRDETDGSISGFLMDWLEEIQCQALFEVSANPYRYNVTYDFVDLDGLPNVSTYNGATATITDGCEDLGATDGVGCLDMLVGDYFINSERTQQFTFPPQPFAFAPVVGFYSTNSVSSPYYAPMIFASIDIIFTCHACILRTHSFISPMPIFTRIRPFRLLKKSTTQEALFVSSKTLLRVIVMPHSSTIPSSAVQAPLLAPN